jgi:outer membrane protein assembly factor BamB
VVAVLTTFAAVACGAARPLAWPQFRGPNGSGVADGQKPPVEFGPEQNVKWKVPAPGGVSSPIVAGDKLVITAFDEGKLYTVAYSRADGKEAWRAEAPAKEIEKYYKAEGSPASSTPATDGRRVVSYFGSCGLFCYDLDGKELWRYEMPTAVTAGDFGSGASPVIADGTVVLVRDAMKDSKVIALDAATGKLKWEKKRQSPASYSTPAVWDTPAGKQVAAPGHARMIGYDLETGEERWSVAAMPSGPCTSPVVADGVLYFAGWAPGGGGGGGEPGEENFQLPPYDELLKGMDTDKDGSVSKAEAAETEMKDFFDNQDGNKDGQITRDEWEGMIKYMSEGKNAAFAVKPGGSGDVTKSHVLWTQTKGLPYIASAIVYQGQFVMVRDGGMVTAYDAATGKEVYRDRAVEGAKYYASPVAADGHIYVTALEDGAVTVLKAGAAKAEVVTENPALGERVAATPAIADDTLYVRTAGHLYAFAKKK